MSKKLQLLISSIVGTAIASSNNVEASELNSNNDLLVNNPGNEKFQKYFKKPMPVLKINFNNPEDSKFVASHVSHRSHSSHSSHRSHFSHRSGGMFA